MLMNDIINSCPRDEMTEFVPSKHWETEQPDDEYSDLSSLQHQSCLSVGIFVTSLEMLLKTPTP